MFNNPLRKYQSGGSTQSAEQALYNAFEKASEILGVSVDDLYNAINKVDDPEVFMQAMESLESKDKDVSSAAFKYFSDLFNPNKMRNGGKVKDFVCKHAKGGKVNCGCGGFKVKMENGDNVPEVKQKVKKGSKMRINTKKPIEYKQLGGTVASMPDNYRGLNRRQSVARLMRDEGMSRADARNLYDTRAEQIGESAYNGAPITATNYGHEGTSRADISYDLFGDNGQLTSRGTMMNAASPWYDNAKSIRQAYRQEKQNLRDAGLRGLAMREQARNNVIGNATTPTIEYGANYQPYNVPINDQTLLIDDSRYSPIVEDNIIDQDWLDNDVRRNAARAVSMLQKEGEKPSVWNINQHNGGYGGVPDMTPGSAQGVYVDIGAALGNKLTGGHGPILSPEARAYRQARRQARRQTIREDQMDALERARNQYNLPLYD